MSDCVTIPESLHNYILMTGAVFEVLVHPHGTHATSMSLLEATSRDVPRADLQCSNEPRQVG